MTTPRSQQELYTVYKTEAQSRTEELTDFSAGSINDAIAGGVSVAASEVVDLIITEFKKTFFRSADGPDITGGDDDLENLAVDHFGEDFARPGAQKAKGIVTFSRANTSAGDVLISLGTIVKTEPDANGTVRRFTVTATVTLTGTSINASVEAVDGEEGTAGNVDAAAVTEIETTLTDSSVVVTNAEAFSGGEAEQDDATYRETIINLIKQLKGATKEALQAKLLTVAGIEQATVIEFLQRVIEYNEATSSTVGSSFLIPHARAFIADANGEANSALITSAEEALTEVRACGVKVDVIGATAVELDWTATLDLDVSGPNYATLSTDTSLIVQSMREYLQELSIGDDFNRALARAAILAEWGSAGTGDLTDFQTTVPSGDVVTDSDERIIPGTLATE